MTPVSRQGRRHGRLLHPSPVLGQVHNIVILSGGCNSSAGMRSLRWIGAPATPCAIVRGATCNPIPRRPGHQPGLRS